MPNPRAPLFLAVGLGATVLAVSVGPRAARAADPPPSAKAEGPPPPAAAAPDRLQELEARLDAVEQQLRIAERRLELAKEKDVEQRRSPLSASFKEGFTLQTDDGTTRLHIGGLVQADGRWFPGNAFPAPAGGPIDAFLVRRARIEVDGKILKYINFRVLPDFAGSRLQLFDAWAEIELFPWLKLRGGKFKVPFGLERLQYAGDIIFVERGFPTSLGPNRDIGAMLHGDVAGGALAWAVGIFNGVGDNTTADPETDDDKEVAARIFVHPFRPTRFESLHQLGVGGAFTWGQSRGSLAAANLPTDRDDGQADFFKFASGPTIDDTTISAGQRLRATAQAYYYLGRVGVLGEYVWSSAEVRRKAWRQAIARQAWQVYASVLLTHDKASWKGVKPAHPLDLEKRGAGAWELALRYSGEQVEDAAFAQNLAGDATSVYADITKAARAARSLAVGVNWYINANAKLQLDFIRTDFEGGARGEGHAAAGNVPAYADRPAENAILGRLQYSL